MTKRFNRVIILAVAALFIFAFRIDTCNADTVASGSCGTDVTWSLDDSGYMEISGTGKTSTFTCADGDWSEYQKQVKKVVVKDGVTDIASAMFKGCSMLEEVELPYGVKYIWGNAFFGCSSLTSVTIPDSVTLIGGSAFLACNNLTNITIPNSVKSIEEGAFSNCSSLESIAIPDGVTSIGYDTFDRCISLTSIIIPDSVTSIGDRAFRNCSSLTSITIPDKVTSIGDYAFNGCSGLVSIIIPDGVTNIGVGSFYGCSSLNGITIPDSVTSIGNNAFYNCTKCYVFYEGTEEEWSALGVDSIGSNKVHYNSTGDHAWDNGEVSTEPTCTTEGEKTFTCTVCGEKRIEKVDTLEHSWAEEYITDKAATCTEEGSKSIHCSVCDAIDESTVTVIPKSDHTFGAWTVTKEATCTEDGSKEKVCADCGDKVVETITSKGHTWNEEYTVDIVPTPDHDGEESIHCSVCDAIKEGSVRVISYEIGIVASGTCGDNLTWVLDDEGILTISGTGDMYDYPNGKGRPWFDYISDIKSIVVDKGVTSLGNSAFSGFTVLESADLPDSLMSIGNCAFANCSKLANVGVPKGITSIGYQTFYYCRALKSIIIPDNILSIGSMAFAGCSGLESIILPEGLTSIDYSSFAFCSSLRSLSVPGSVTNIGISAFEGCNSLESLELLDGVERINDKAFNSCSNLENITIAESVTSIGNLSFSGCNSIKNATFYGNAPYAHDQSFSDYQFSINTHIGSAGWDNAPWNTHPLKSKHFMNEETIIEAPTCTETGIKEGFCKVCNKTVAEEIPATGHDYVDGICNVCGEREVLDSGTGWVLYTNGLLEITEMHDGLSFINNEQITDAIFLSDATIIGARMFEGCKNLKSVTLPETATYIHIDAFHGCSSLENIVLPDSVTIIDESAFYGCTSLKSITMNGVTAIGITAFDNCTSLKNLILPDGLLSIYKGAFAGCSSLENVTFPDSLRNIGQQAFTGCSNLKSITIPNKITKINDGTFSNCTNLETITIPRSVNTISETAFEGCDNAVFRVEKNSAAYSFVTENNYNYEIFCSHSPVIDEAVEPDCDTVGYTEGSHCSICGEILEAQEVIPALEHDWNTEPTIILATCTDSGSESIRCSRCKAIKDGTEIITPAVGHHFSNWIGTIAATEINAGQNTRTCSSCGITETQVIAQLAPSLPTVKISKPKAAKKAVTVKWKKVSKKNQKKIGGIEIQVATDSAFTNIIKSTTAGKKKTSKKIKGLTSKQTVWVRIRAYKNAADGKHVSAWKVKKVKIK